MEDRHLPLGFVSCVLILPLLRPEPGRCGADAERNRRRILAAASCGVRRAGARRHRSTRSRRHAGVGVGTVYRRFADKAQLIDALFEERIDDARGATPRTPSTLDDPWERAGPVHASSASSMHAADRGLREVVFDGGRGGERLAAARARIAPAGRATSSRGAQASGQLRADAATTDVPMVQLMLLRHRRRGGRGLRRTCGAAT